MILKTFVEPPIGNNNYLIIDEETKDAALIDCSAVDDEINKTIKKYNANLRYILLTHGHFDHISGISYWQNNLSIVNESEIKVLMHFDDMIQVRNVNRYMPMFGMPEITIPRIDGFIKDGDIIKLGNIEIKVIHTPGHTQGGVCFYTDGKLFSGDTIFRESVGRCDLEGGDFNQIVDSIKTKIFTLPPETQIFPGHGKFSTVEWEVEHNQFM